MRTFQEAEALASRSLTASDLLLANGFNNQAVARAYYAVYVLVTYTLNRTPSFTWPIWPPGEDSRPPLKQGRLQHRWLHDYAETLYRFAGRPPINLIKAPTPRHAVKELSGLRITADYLSAIEIGSKFAGRLVANAKELVRVILPEARKVQGNPVHVVNQ